METSAQTFTLNRQLCGFTPERAATVWWLTWDSSLKDTSIAPFIKQGFDIRVGANTMHVSFDSVMGRGGARRVMLTMSQKLADSAYWYHWRYLDSASFKLPPDSVWYAGTDSARSFWHLARVTTVVPTADSTFKDTRWFEPFDGINYDLTAWAIDDSTIVRVAFEKVIGDPTLHYGRNQRALLKVRAKANIPAELDTLLNNNWKMD